MSKKHHTEGAVNTAKAVANFFLEKGFKEGVSIDQLKLQKLVYYSHAWHLGNDLGPLFPDDIEAWPHGPVIRDLYVDFKDAGRKPIQHFAFDLDGRMPVVDPDVDPQSIQLLEEVWKAYRDLSGIQLSNSTHGTAEPWSIVARHYGALESKPRIPNELIENVFRAKLTDAAA
ncbi:MAG: DUF4065 domain-containing protein [Alphaproteobacteria bacterium]|jgi:uncharacterized phage-associated protein|nr:DUF4065 domain-containing protein [Alphaproteobacteria bacterium]